MKVLIIQQKMIGDVLTSSILFEAIKIIEITLRTQVVQCYASKFGPFGYTDASNFSSKFKHREWIEKAQKQIKKKKNNHLAIQNFYNKYENEHLPLWIFAEYVTFGSLSLMLKGMHTEDRKNISRFFNAPHQIFINWIHVLVYIRNICAHHSRLWNLKLKIPPVRLEKNLGKIEKVFIHDNKIFSIVNIVLHLLNTMESPITDRYKNNLTEAMKSIHFLKNHNLEEIMGFTNGWEKSELWR